MDGKSCARLLVIAGFTRIHAATDILTGSEISRARNPRSCTVAANRSRH